MKKKRMIRTIIQVLIFSMITSNAYAFSLKDISADNRVIQELGVDTETDKQYLADIADKYRDRYVVTEESYIDCGDIDDFFKNLSQPITLEEIDSGKLNIDFSGLGDKEYREFLKSFKVLGGMSGYSAEFEPIVYYNVYRDVSLIGGYVKYTKVHAEVYPSYWDYVCGIESITKEIVPYETRIMLLNKLQNLSDKIDNDKSFKVFILKNGKIDSMFENSGGCL